MFSLSPVKILVVVAIALILLGPDKLPEFARQVGGAWRSLKSLQERVETEVRDAIPDLPSTSDIARIARSPINLLNTIADRTTAPSEPDSPDAGNADGEATNERADDDVMGEPETRPMPVFAQARALPDLPEGPPDPSWN